MPRRRRDVLTEPTRSARLRVLLLRRPLAVSELERLHDALARHERLARLLAHALGLGLCGERAGLRVRRAAPDRGAVGVERVGEPALVQCLERALALLLEEERLVELLPYADGFVVRAGDDELAVVADGKRPDFAVVTLEFLNVFELETPR